MAKSTSAITFDIKFYIFVKFFPSNAIDPYKAELMLSRGNQVVLTRMPKGLVLWTIEADAELVNR